MVGICRLCASLRKFNLLTTIKDRDHEVCSKLRQCCQLDINMDDVLPKEICKDCMLALDASFSFYTKVQESQESLKALFPKTETNENGKDVLGDNTTEKSLAEYIAKAVKHKIVPALLTREMPTENQDIVIEEQAKRRKLVEEPVVGEEPANDAYLTEVYTILNTENSQEQQIQKNHEEEHEISQVIVENEDSDNFSLSSTKHQQESNEFEYEAKDVSEDQTDESSLIDIVENNEKEDEIHHLENKAADVCKIDTLSEWSSYTWRCYLCPYFAPNIAALHEHTRILHDVLPTDNSLQYKCSDCQKTCLRYNVFVNHVRWRHHPKLSLRCDACDVCCSSFVDLMEHRLYKCDAATKCPPLELCSECGKGFGNQNGVQVHMRTQHMELEHKFKCTKCDKKFKRNGALMAHQRVHSDVREFSCELCGRTFRHKVNLESHLYSHISEKTFACKICDKSFKTSINLEKHCLLHTDTKHFDCDFCEKVFRTKDEKLSHQRTHTGENPYKCEFCNRSFRFRSTYTSHINMHTGQKPYCCEDCDHHFTNWSNYNKHMKRRHNTTATKVAAKANSKENTSASKTKQTVQAAVDFESCEDDPVECS